MDQLKKTLDNHTSINNQQKKINQQLQSNDYKVSNSKQNLLKSMNKYLQTSPKNRIYQKTFHYQQQSDNQLQKCISYRNTLRKALQKNKQLEIKLFESQKKYLELKSQNQKLTNLNKSYHYQVTKLQKIKQKYTNKFKNIEDNISTLKEKLNIKSVQKYQSINQKLQYIDQLKQQKDRYAYFIDALRETIVMLNGNNPKDLKSLWNEWKKIFETVSLNACQKQKI